MRILVRRGDRVLFWCPGCDDVHMVPVTPDNPDGWSFDGNYDAPTLTPSLLTRHGGRPGDRICHLFVRGGRLVFLADCTHTLAGQTVPMGPVPLYLIPETNPEQEAVPR